MPAHFTLSAYGLAWERWVFTNCCNACLKARQLLPLLQALLCLYPFRWLHKTGMITTEATAMLHVIMRTTTWHHVSRIQFCLLTGITTPSQSGMLRKWKGIG